MNRFQKMRKVCKGYLERIPPLLMQGFQWGADWLREKILDLEEYLKRNSLRILALNTPYVIIFYLSRLRNAASRINTAFFCYKNKISPQGLW